MESDNQYVTVRADDLYAAMVGTASAYGSSTKNKDGEYVLPWFGRLADALEKTGYVGYLAKGN
jgi:hypothetical protein